MSFPGNAGIGPLVRRILLWIIFPLLAVQAVSYAAKPVIVSSVPDLTIFEGQQIQIIIKAYDPDGDSIYYALDHAPSGTILSDSIITWTAPYFGVGMDSIIYSVHEWPSTSQFVSDTVYITVLDAGIAGSYQDRSSARGLDDAGMTNAAAWADYNNDGFVDVFVANAGEAGTLYLGDSSGAFTRQSALPAAGNDASSAAWADYNHDGRIDLYAVHSGIFGGQANALYHNDPGGGFTDTTQVSGTGNRGMGKSVSWVDFDVDGDPDIYVVNHGSANELYSNNNNGTFTRMADSVGLADAGDGVAAAWCDFNLDNLPDLYLVNEHGDNRLYLNNADFIFTEVTADAGVSHTGNGGAAAWGDYDNDGDFDLFLANKDSLQVLFRNNGDATFTRLGASTGLSVRGTARSAVWLDFNMDGLLDLFVAFSDSANKLFQNMGDTTFVNVAPLIGIDDPGYWTSVTWADPRNAGVPDIYLGRRDGANRYYEGLQQGNYLKVGLRGLISSRFGIGARVRLRSGSAVMTRWIDGGSGSMSEPLALFGLGTANLVDSLSVFWPSGIRLDTTALAVNQILVLNETDSIFPIIDTTTVYPHTTDITGPYSIDTWITDNDPLEATLFYSAERYSPSYSTVDMTDLGGGQYQAQIPGQESGTRVYYYIRAIDSPGHKSYDPLWAPDSLYSFSVDDSVPTVDSITVLDDTGDEQGPYRVVTRVADNDTVNVVYLVWTIYREGELIELDSLEMEFDSADSAGYEFIFTGELEGRQIGTQIDYYVRAVDLAGNYTHLPANAPDSAVSFRISRFSEKAFTGFEITHRGTGVAVADYNRDQIADVFLANRDTIDYLFQGSPDGLFSDVSAAAIGTDMRASTGGVWGDYNNDGYPDLYIYALGENVLFSNDGEGTFTDITAAAGVGDAGQSWGAAWVDYDNDGLQDLFVVNQDGTDRLFHNLGDSTFEDLAGQVGLAGHSGGVGCSWADFDNDGDQDLFVVYYGSENLLYSNHAGADFSQVRDDLGSLNSISAAWFDYDNDSRLDLYVVGQTEDRLYRSSGFRSFSAVEMQAAGLGESPGGFGLAWGDFDNNGYPDFCKTRGETGQPDINVLYRAEEGGTFLDYTYESGTHDPGEYRGVVWLDYDRDGRLDLLLNNRSGPPRLYRNNDLWENNHYLRVRLVGTRSNAEGIGAKVSLTTNGGTQSRELGTGTGFAGQNEPVLHFGLGAASAVDTLVVSWPSGIVQSMFNLDVDRLVTITERDTLFPLITRHDTIADQYQIVHPPDLTCEDVDRDSLTIVRVRHRTAEQDTFSTAAMVLDSVSAGGSAVVGYWQYTMPDLPAGSVNLWRIVASDLRGSTDSTALFQYAVAIDSLSPRISFLEKPDSILPDTSGPYSFRVRIIDDTGLGRASFVLEGLTHQGDTVDTRLDTVLTAKPDSIDTAGDTIRIRPLPGKSTLDIAATDVADLLRMVYLVLGVVEAASLVDTLGLDLDRNGYFDTADLVKLLDIWHNGAFTGMLLASGASEADPAVAGLVAGGMEGGIAFQLENSMYLPYAVVELEIEPASAARKLRLSLSDRLAGLLHLQQIDAESGSIILVFAAAPGTRGLAPGRGPLFTIGKSEVGPQSIAIKRVHLGGRKVIVERNLSQARESVLPKSFALAQNVPNPFNPSTTIRFALPAARRDLHQVRLTVYNLRGRTISTLLEGSLNPGYHSVVWNGSDRHGKPLPSGIYFYRLQVNERVFTRKMILLK